MIPDLIDPIAAVLASGVPASLRGAAPAASSFIASARALRPFGEQIREWRRRRALTQLELALRADVSTKHLSFLETGRSQPSRAMLLRLADRLALPRPDRDRLLVAAGYAPMYAALEPSARASGAGGGRPEMDFAFHSERGTP